jgi:mersacidin/lichenicidin family type 2 lantibiotic
MPPLGSSPLRITDPRASKAKSERNGKIMKPEDIIRAWKDEVYRASLNEAERAQLPEHPAGLIELEDGDLVGAAVELPSSCLQPPEEPGSLMT